METLVGLLQEHAARRPDAVALRNKHLGIWEEISWAAYRDAVAATAAQLDALGVRAEDQVAILSDNRPEWLYADLGAQALGARSVGVYQTNPPEDVAYVVDHSGSKLLFCEDQEQVDKAVAIADQTPTVQQVVVFDPRGCRHIDDPRLVSWDDFLAAGRARLAALPDDWFAMRVDAADPDAASMIVYTSGTTGQPKGALLSPRNALAAAAVMVPLLAVSDRDSMLSYLPLCHVAEKIFSLFLPLSTGAVVHFGESIATVQQDLREVSPTVFLGVPRIWEKVQAGVVLRMQDSSPLKRWLFARCLALGQRVADPTRATPPGLLDRLRWRLADVLIFRPLQERLGLRRCRIPVTGAAPISPQLIAWFHAIGVPVLEGYGQTECAGVSHVNLPGAVRPGTVGPVLPCLDQRIADDGEILVRGPCVFKGYLHDPDATARTVDEHGWLHTGDVGQLDGGALRITGRKKEIIITAGGKNLSPEKIENALKLSPYVKEAVAIGDGRKYVSALIQLDRDAVGDRMTRQGVAFTDFADLAARPQVVDLIQAEVHAANVHLARVEQVRAFRLFPKELHQDDGELTATQKVRRREVLSIWASLIEELYS